MIRRANKIPITIMIGNGSKLPKLIKAAKSPQSEFYINLVISHKKKSKGIKLALKNNISSVIFNLVDWRKRTGMSRSQYMHYLGWFISQNEYSPKLLVFVGWDLVMDKNFFDFFKCNFGSGFSAINLHPALLPIKGEKSKIELPDGAYSPIIKGEQEDVLKTVIAKKLTCYGPSVHFMVPTKFDTGQVVEREFISVGKSKSISQLRKKLMPIEDKILISSINKIILKYIK